MGAVRRRLVPATGQFLSINMETEGEQPSTSAGFDVRIKSYHAVASWTWAAGDDVCGICRMPFDGCPPDSKYPGDDSPVVWGVCTHAFHLQCINRWLSTQVEQKCPFCRRAWEFKQAEVDQQ